MLQAYIDDGGKDDSSDTFVLAGYIAPAENWARFSDEWQQLLDLRSPHHRQLEYFRMREMLSEVDRERCGRFYGVIEKHVSAAVSCVIDTRALRDVVMNAEWFPYINGAEKLTNPYYFAFKAIIDVLLQHRDELGLNDPVNFIFGDESEKTECVGGWDLLRMGASPEKLQLMGDTPAFRDYLKVLPLQAADLYAYWALQWEIEGSYLEGVQELRFPWPGERRDMIRLASRFDAQEVRKSFDVTFSPFVEVIKYREKIRTDQLYAVTLVVVLFQRVLTTGAAAPS